jgi:hypothetical protein
VARRQWSGRSLPSHDKLAEFKSGREVGLFLKGFSYQLLDDPPLEKWTVIGSRYRWPVLRSPGYSYVSFSWSEGSDYRQIVLARENLLSVAPSAAVKQKPPTSVAPSAPNLCMGLALLAWFRFASPIPLMRLNFHPIVAFTPSGSRKLAVSWPPSYTAPLYRHRISCCLTAV